MATAMFAAGCALGLRFAPDNGTVAGLCAVFCALCAVRLVVAPTSGRAALLAVLALQMVIGAATGAATSAQWGRDCRLRLRDGSHLEVTGVLEGMARDGGGTTIAANAVRLAGEPVACRGAFRVRLPPGQRLSAGTVVRATGRWWVAPHTARWPQSPDHAGTLSVRTVIVDPAENGRPLLALRGRAQERIRGRFAEEAGLVEAVLLARREALDPAIRQSFAAAGLSHLLAISGTHVGLIAGTVLLLARVARFPARMGAAVAALGTAAYVLLLGAPHAAARAALQVLLLLGARLAQRPADPFALMATAALVLLAVRPAGLLDPGFQLSFAGVFGLLAFTRPLARRLPRSLPHGLGSAIAATAAATATTLPIAALHFGLVSFVGLLTNLVAVPLLALAVPAAALALAADVLHPAAGLFVAGGAAVPFALLRRLATLAAAVPGGHAFWSPATVGAVLSGVGAGLIVLHAVARGSTSGRSPWHGRALALSAAAIIATAPVARFGGGDLQIHVIDVGQGEAIAIRSPSARWILVDAGPRSDRWDAGLSRVLPYLRARGVSTLDVLLLTHPDLDHIGGAPAVLRGMRVNVLLDPAWPAPKEGFLETTAAARERGVRWFAARAGREIRVDGVVLTVLAPSDSALDGPGSANDLSVVFRLGWGRFGALFTGDAPRSVENGIAALHDSALDVDLLKVGHHGSRTSTGDSLLAAARPRLAVVSVGARNRYGHPAADVIDRLARHRVQVLRTDLHGNVVVRVTADGRISYTSER